MRTFFIYPNLRKQSAREILPSVCEQLRGRDIRLILPNQMRGTMHALHDEVMALDYMDTAEAVRIADAAVVLGGDGTMLRIARAAAQNDLPLLGINVGHVGFMTELEPAELDKMQALLEGDYQLDSRMMLHVEVERHGRRVYENDALNDIVIAKGTAFRVVRVGISADGEEVTRFNGDGVTDRLDGLRPVRRRPGGRAERGKSGGHSHLRACAGGKVVRIRARAHARHHGSLRGRQRGVHLGGRRTGVRRASGRPGAHHALCAAHAADPSQGQQLLPNTAAEAVIL